MNCIHIKYEYVNINIKEILDIMAKKLKYFIK